MSVCVCLSVSYQLPASRGKHGRGGWLGVAGVHTLPFANTTGEQVQKLKVCMECLPVPLCEFAPGPVHSRYRIWNAPDANTTPDPMLFLSPML